MAIQCAASHSQFTVHYSPFIIALFAAQRFNTT